jgi:hypothetical protein
MDIYLLAKNMGTSVQMIQKHYSHMEVIQRARELIGDTDREGGYLAVKGDPSLIQTETGEPYTLLPISGPIDLNAFKFNG